MADRYRVGLVVPRPNVTMETEIPALPGLGSRRCDP